MSTDAAAQVALAAARPAVLQILQPAARDSASIAAAIARGEAAEAEARANAEKAKESWSQMLLTADDAQMEELERAAASSLRDADRIAAALPQLRQDLDAAKKRETREAAVRLIEEANAAGQTFMDRWIAKYPGLSLELGEILHIEKRALELRSKAHAATKALPAEDSDDLPALRDMAREMFDGPAIMGELIQLPNVDGTMKDAPWHDLRRQVRLGSSAGEYTRRREAKEQQRREEERQRAFKEARRRELEAEQDRLGSHASPEGYIRAGAVAPQRVINDRYG